MVMVGAANSAANHRINKALEKEMTSALKLTDAQVKVLVELNTNGVLPKGTQPRTIEKLRQSGMIDVVRFGVEDTQYIITAEGQKEIGVPVVDREKVAQIQEIEELLDTNPWDEAQAVQEVMFGGGENGDKADSVDDVKYVKDSDGILKRTDGLQADTFDDTMAPWEKELLGFGETLKWRNTKVWDGLTAEQIRKDLDTAGPVNRAARRRGQKISRQFLKALSKAAL